MPAPISVWTRFYLGQPPVETVRPIIDPNYGLEADVLSPFHCRRGAIRMRGKHIICAITAAGLASTGALAEAPKRIGAEASPISTSVSVQPGGRLVYISGTVPDVIDPKAPEGSIARFGDTEVQTRSVLRKVEAALAAQGLGLGDVVMMRVFLVAPAGQRMDFAGMMKAYREFFGTAAQPNKPARSTMQVAGLVDPGWLVEIEVTAAK